MKIVNHKNINIHYWTFGKGSPIVFLHGFLEDHTMWTSIKKELIKNYKVILIDLPCHGLTRFNGDVCTMKLMAECVHQVLREEKIINPYIFGHSMGGYVGLELLKLTPIKLTLVHSNFWADSPEKQKDRNRVIDIVKTKKSFFINEAIPNLFYRKNIKRCEKDIQQLIKKASTIPAQQIISATKGMRDRLDNLSLLKRHHINIIQGQHDPIIPENAIRNHLNGLKKDKNYYTIKNVGHMSIWEDKKQLMTVIKQIIFLSI